MGLELNFFAEDREDGRGREKFFRPVLTFEREKKNALRTLTNQPPIPLVIKYIYIYKVPPDLSSAHTLTKLLLFFEQRLERRGVVEESSSRRRRLAVVVVSPSSSRRRRPRRPRLVVLVLVVLG